MTTITNKRSKESEEAIQGRMLLHKIDKKQLINVKGGFMAYTKHFKCLDISYNLQDN
jgi:hypothetical protein